MGILLSRIAYGQSPGSRACEPGRGALDLECPLFVRAVDTGVYRRRKPVRDRIDRQHGLTANDREESAGNDRRTPMLRRNSRRSDGSLDPGTRSQGRGVRRRPRCREASKKGETGKNLSQHHGALRHIGGRREKIHLPGTAPWAGCPLFPDRPSPTRAWAPALSDRS